MKSWKMQLILSAMAVLLGVVAGCQSPLFVNGQSPDSELPVEEENRWQLVGEMTSPGGMSYEWVQGVGLVTGLDNTGSDPPPSAQRDALIDEMETHETAHPQTLLASPTTSLVEVRGFLPPGVQKGDRIDIEVTLPERSETTSLEGGWLMQARMRQLAMLNNSVHKGNIDALAGGDVLVDAVFNESDEEVGKLRGRVLGGGISLKSRKLGLILRDEEASVRMSSLIAAAINNRFHYFDHGNKAGVARPINSHHIELAVARPYQRNVARYMRVVQNISLGESPADHLVRLQMLESKLLEPTSAATAALQLEALGKEGVDILRKGLNSTDPEVRFYSAEALAYFDEGDAAPVLAEAAAKERAFRWHALTALSAMDHVAAFDALSELLNHPSAETRYGAFRAMQIRNPKSPVINGEVVGERFALHQVATTAEPMIHFARARRPEVVLFGLNQTINPPPYLMAGKRIMIKRHGTSELKVIRFVPGKEEQVLVCSTRVDDLIRTIVEVGGGYEEVYEAIHSAKLGGFLPARLAVNAQTRGGRVYHRSDADAVEDAEPERFQVPNPIPELFQDRLDSPPEESDSQDDRFADDDYSETTTEDSGFFGRMKGWFGSE